MTPEGKVKRKIKEWIKVHLPEAWHVSPRGGPFGKAGCPDILVCWMGVFIAIEIKADESAHVSELQMHQLRLITKAGGVAALVKGYDVPRLEAIKRAAEKKLCHSV